MRMLGFWYTRIIPVLSFFVGDKSRGLVWACCDVDLESRDVAHRAERLSISARDGVIAGDLSIDKQSKFQLTGMTRLTLV